MQGAEQRQGSTPPRLADRHSFPFSFLSKTSNIRRALLRAPHPFLLPSRPSAAPKPCPSSHRRVHCHVPTGLCPHFTDREMRPAEVSAPARSQNPAGPTPARMQPFSSVPPRCQGLCAPRWCPPSVSMPADSPPHGQGSPHFSVPGPRATRT